MGARRRRWRALGGEDVGTTVRTEQGKMRIPFIENLREAAIRARAPSPAISLFLDWREIIASSRGRYPSGPCISETPADPARSMRDLFKPEN